MEHLTDEKIIESQKRFEESLGDSLDPVIIVLKGHLFSENQLENLIFAGMPRGDRVLEYGNLSYYQKLALVDSLDILPDNLISTFRGVNKLRNKLAHNLDTGVSYSEIVRVGSSLGKEFTQLKHESENDQHLLWGVIHHACGKLTAASIRFEAKNTNSSISKV